MWRSCQVPPQHRPEKHLCHGGGSARSLKHTFEIEAVNGVSDLSPGARQYVSVNVTTNQAGKCDVQPNHVPWDSSVSYLPSSRAKLPEA